MPTDNYYLRWGAEPVTYSAFYPVVSGASTANFTLPTNQQRLENLAKADYMTCTVENVTDDGSRILRLGMNRKNGKSNHDACRCRRTRQGAGSKDRFLSGIHEWRSGIGHFFDITVLQFPKVVRQDRTIVLILPS